MSAAVKQPVLHGVSTKPFPPLPRPKESDDAVMRAAMTALAKALEKSGLIDVYEGEEGDDTVGQLVDAYDCDGYAFAKSLDDDHHWIVDAALVEEIDGASVHVREALDAAIAAWVVDMEIAPAFKVGDRVSFVDPHTGKPRDAEVYRVDAAHGRYAIGDPAGDGKWSSPRTIPFEDVRAVGS